MLKTFPILLLSALLFSNAQTVFAQSQPTSNESKINWISLQEADRLRRAEPRKVMIDVYTDWCGWCKRMDRTTFVEPNLVKYVNENYYAVKLDAEQRESITVGGKKYDYDPNMGRRGVHQIAQELLQGKMSYPTIVFLDESMNMIQPIPGFMEAKDMQPILEYLASEAYKETPWEEWLAARKSNQ